MPQLEKSLCSDEDPAQQPPAKLTNELKSYVADTPPKMSVKKKRKESLIIPAPV